MSNLERGDVTVVRAVLPKPGEMSDLILIMQRSFDDFHNPGKWELPGGKLDEGDGAKLYGDAVTNPLITNDAILVAGCREIIEETGFEVRFNNNSLSLVDRYVIQDGKRMGQLYIAYAGVARYVSGEFKRSEEHINQQWLTSTEILTTLDITPSTGKALGLYATLELGIIDHPSVQVASEDL